MTAARVASPEGWQVSVRLFGGSCGSVLGAGGPVFGMLVVGTLVVEGPRGWMGGGGRWLVSGLVLGGLVVAALGVASAGVMQVGALIVGWCWRAGRGTGSVVVAGLVVVGVMLAGLVRS